MRRLTTFLLATALAAACDSKDEPAPAKSAQTKTEAPKPAAKAAAPTPEPSPDSEPDDQAVPESDEAAAQAKVDKAVELALEIEANSERLEEILTDAGMTQEEFSALLFELAEDPELAEAYASAREVAARERAPSG